MIAYAVQTAVNSGPELMIFVLLKGIDRDLPASN